MLISNEGTLGNIAGAERHASKVPNALPSE
jgi:hypothetical protein